MPKKEYYKHNLPHFQQPGQVYFVTWSLNDAVPKHVLKHFALKLEILKSQIDGFSSGAADSDPKGICCGLETMKPGEKGLANSNSRFFFFNRDSEIARPGKFASPGKEVEKLKKEYNSIRKRYLKAYNDLLDAQRNHGIDLSKPANTRILKSVLFFWEGKRLNNYAFCIMPNHVHWVFKVLEKDENGEPVYLQDILYSIKRFSANQINKHLNRSGALWQKESFDTTIRDHTHLYNSIEYTLNNPINAGFIKNRNDWSGNWCAD